MSQVQDRGTCPICNRNYTNAHETAHDGQWFDCQVCGKYEISRSAIPGVPSKPDKHLLSAFIRQANELESLEPVITTTWPAKVQHLKHTSIRQRQDKLLRMLRGRTLYPGAVARYDPNFDYPVFDCLDSVGARYLADDLKARGLIEPLFLKDPSQIRISVAGWEYLDPIAGGAPNTAFVAMSFHPDLDQAYQQGILPALRDDCSKSVIRIKEEHFREMITDRIIAEIRRARIVVADMTRQRQNVYFEAGFAMGMDRLVIFTCRRDEAEDIHFDTNQYQHILWDTPDDLREQLKNRIKRLGA